MDYDPMTIKLFGRVVGEWREGPAMAGYSLLGRPNTPVPRGNIPFPYSIQKSKL